MDEELGSLFNFYTLTWALCRINLSFFGKLTKAGKSDVQDCEKEKKTEIFAEKL